MQSTQGLLTTAAYQIGKRIGSADVGDEGNYKYIVLFMYPRAVSYEREE